MLKPIDLVTFYDLFRLSKKQLLSLATDLELSSDSAGMSIAELSDEIYRKISTLQNSAEDLSEHSILSYYDAFFAGRGSISWFKSAEKDGSDTLSSFIKKLTEVDERKPFDRTLINSDFDEKLQNTDPLLIGATELLEGKFLLRYATKTGYSSQPSVTKNNTYLRFEIANVFIIPKNHIVEVRSSRIVATKIARAITKYIIDSGINEAVEFKQIDFNEDLQLDDDDGPVEYFSKKLKGTVLENVDIPKELYENMSKESIASMNNIFSAIDSRISASEPEGLIDVNTAIDNAQGSLFKNFPDVSFFALILSGLAKVDLGAESELRETPLYQSLGDHLKTKTTYIKFKPNISGTTSEEFTIRIGLTTNSVVFPINTTEDVIKSVRNSLF